MFANYKDPEEELWQKLKSAFDNDSVEQFEDIIDNLPLSKYKMLRKLIINNGFLAKSTQTLLHLAAEKNHYKILSSLIKFVGKVNLKDNNGKTPLYEAAYKGNIESFIILLLDGANLLCQSSYKSEGYNSRTPLSVALSNPDLRKTNKYNKDHAKSFREFANIISNLIFVSNKEDFSEKLNWVGEILREMHNINNLLEKKSRDEWTKDICQVFLRKIDFTTSDYSLKHDADLLEVYNDLSSITSAEDYIDNISYDFKNQKSNIFSSTKENDSSSEEDYFMTESDWFEVKEPKSSSEVGKDIIDNNGKETLLTSYNSFNSIKPASQISDPYQKHNFEEKNIPLKKRFRFVEGEITKTVSNLENCSSESEDTRVKNNNFSIARSQIRNDLKNYGYQTAVKSSKSPDLSKRTYVRILKEQEKRKAENLEKGRNILGYH